MAASITFLQSATDGTNLTTYTFSSQNLGTADPNRKIIVVINGRSSDGGARTVSSVTVAGVTATINVDTTTSGNVCAIATAKVPTGTSGDVVVTFSNTMGDGNIGLFRVLRIGTTAFDTGTSTADPLSTTLDNEAGGVAVGIATTDVGTATATWTGLTKDFDDATGGGNDRSGASQAFAGANTGRTIQCDWTSEVRQLMAVASFSEGDIAVDTQNALFFGGGF